jgi:hypothetical protein
MSHRTCSTPLVTSRDATRLARALLERYVLAGALGLIGLIGCGAEPDALESPGDLAFDSESADESSSAAIATPTFLGQTNCPAGSPGCNSCVNDVRRALDDGFAGGFSWDRKPWRFSWTRSYAPANVRPDSAYQDGSILPDHHVQGFVRTNSSRIRFMMTHSDETRGSISRIEQLADGRKQLATLVGAGIPHPSGGQVLGKFFLFAEGNTLRVLDVDGPATNLRLSFPTTDTQRSGARGAGGGLGAVRLADGRTLIIASTPGGEAAATRRTLFYTKPGTITDAGALTLVGETNYSQPAAWRGDYQRSENLSVLTECGTGTIYTLHATGEVDGLRGYYRLSRVDTAANGRATLTTIKAYNMNQNIFDCHLRSSGTAFATPQHTLELYCHQWSTQRLFGLSGGEFEFTVGN